MKHISASRVSLVSRPQDLKQVKRLLPIGAEKTAASFQVSGLRAKKISCLLFRGQDFLVMWTKSRMICVPGTTNGQKVG